MKNICKKTAAVALSMIIILQSISWDGLYSIYTAYAEDMDTEEEAETDSETSYSTGRSQDIIQESATGTEADAEQNTGTSDVTPTGLPLNIEGGLYEGSLNINQDTYLTDDLVIEGNLNLYPSTFRLNGHHLTIHGDLRLYGDQTYLKVDGVLETIGGFESHGSNIVVQNGTWICREDLILNYPVYIQMTGEEALLKISKDLVVTSNYGGELDFSEGTLMLGGDYLELPGNNGIFEGEGIQAGEEFRIILNGTDSQMLDMESENTILKHVSASEGEPRLLYLPKYDQVPEETIEGLILCPDIYRITQNQYDYNNSHYITNYYYNNVYFEGDTLNVNRITIYGNFYHKGNVMITGDSSIHGDYGVESLQYDEGILTFGSTEGRLSIQSSVKVDGSFITRSVSDHEMTDWKGRLTIGDSLFQYGSGIANFNPGSSFRCVLNGAEPHLYFEDSEHNWMPTVDRSSSEPVILDTQVQFTNTTSGVYDGEAYVKNENMSMIGSAAVMSVYMDELLLNNNIIYPKLSLHMRGQTNLNGYNLICKDLILEDNSNASILMTQGETLTIYNDLYVASQSNESRMSKGTIYLYGNLTQKNTGVADNFTTTDQCVIWMMGNDRGQFVSFDEGSGSIETMKIHNQGGGYVRFLTEVPVKNLIRETDTLIGEAPI